MAASSSAVTSAPGSGPRLLHAVLDRVLNWANSTGPRVRISSFTACGQRCGSARSTRGAVDSVCSRLFNLAIRN
ncbi:hypothetical protein HBB16_14700 [Pseudonocardia sp. MCCB 268]|nr:hypothetical protein [Pseudonocardia cytotoxica]